MDVYVVYCEETQEVDSVYVSEQRAHERARTLEDVHFSFWFVERLPLNEDEEDES